MARSDPKGDRRHSRDSERALLGIRPHWHPGKGRQAGGTSPTAMGTGGWVPGREQGEAGRKAVGRWVFSAWEAGGGGRMPAVCLAHMEQGAGRG